jgi:D-ribose pyranase
MKKTGVLNQPLSHIIAGLGHMDTLVIADAGLPIPDSTERIDLAVCEGVPAFADVLRAVLSELEVQEAIVAQELNEVSPLMSETIHKLLGATPIQTVPHEEFKARTHHARAVVRTGEFTPYTNIILIAGVIF